ncbi:predicted GNAT superfamily acetyltransferase [Ureibacillus xyleni]|uniref:Predicted GNAT superfamily acetyltransferase n=1 Tax=Ureibacillus xyleni TaxID=614648 RepID=A0A285SXE8_9BACL|nr:GNAT family N-acetyltransferase [Ureibacillus xyleni]SOC13336.1 predicted GNAT superfamily acetyltransferase [Ureibacillus xyleni]
MIQVRELTTLEEMEQVQLLEKQVWGIEPIPTHQTLTAVKNGGIMVGAYDDEKLVGFSYGFAGFKNSKVSLCSHMLGIDENYRSQQIGEQLKHAQRTIAISKGYDMMHWTYDPLETRNGYLNLTKLNGVCHTYIENCYGEMKDGFNQGLPSDRFEVHWYLKSPYVEKQIEPQISHPQPLGEIIFDEAGLPSLKIFALDALTSEVYSLPVPWDFQSLKAKSQEHAMHWRMETRKVFQKVFAAGYTAVRIQKNDQWNSYIFVKKDTLELGGNEDENC